MADTKLNWDLKKIIAELVSEFPAISEIYLFGSRAYQTSSLRSDIDLLVISDTPIPAVNLFGWVRGKYEPVDIFKSTDKKNAESVVNGSVLFTRDGFADLPTQLDAIPLWNKSNSFNTGFNQWVQQTRKGVRHDMTYAYVPYSMSEAIKDYEKYLDENAYPNTNLGNEWEQISSRLIKKIEHGLTTAKSWTGSSGTFNSVKLSNERDFQNFIELILKPWLPSTQRETTAAKFDSQEKNIDFSLELDRILIEAKHIKDANTEAKAVKEIEGITKFYLANTNVKLLMFICLVEDGFPKDIPLFEKTFSKHGGTTLIVTKCYSNILK